MVGLFRLICCRRIILCYWLEGSTCLLTESSSRKFVSKWLILLEHAFFCYGSLAYDVIAAMLEDGNKRFLISLYCWSIQHGCHVFAIWFSRDWLQAIYSWFMLSISIFILPLWLLFICYLFQQIFQHLLLTHWRVMLPLQRWTLATFNWTKNEEDYTVTICLSYIKHKGQYSWRGRLANNS